MKLKSGNQICDFIDVSIEGRLVMEASLGKNQGRLIFILASSLQYCNEQNTLLIL